MERGTQWELVAVQERWTELEREHRLASRLAFSLLAFFVGLVLLLLSEATGTEICLAAQRLPGTPCDGVLPLAMKPVLQVAGTLAIVGSLWGSRPVFRG